MSGDVNAEGDELPRVRVLGAVTVDGQCVTRAQGGIISALALRPGEAFSTEALIHALWPEAVPRSARSSLQNQLARLRRSFGDDLIGTSREGYRLLATTDVQYFEHHAAIGCGEDIPPSESVEVLERILGLWSGEPFASLAEHSEAEFELNRLVVLRLRVEERLAAARLAAGQTERAISELMVLAEAEPYREHRWELLMRALAGSGRRAEALAAYERMAARFMEELGAPPSQTLENLGEQIRTKSMPAPTTASGTTPNGLSTEFYPGCAGRLRLRSHGRCSGFYRTHRTSDGAE